jgi:hypothetical protein
MSLIDHPVSQPSLDISPIWTSFIRAEVKKLQLRPLETEWGNLYFCVGTIRRICLSSDDLFSDSSLVQGLIRVEFLIFLRFRLSSRIWFVYPICCWHRCPEIGSSSIDWAQLRKFYLKTETESSL